jgi:hypothetical protein
MAWIILNADLIVSNTSVACRGGKIMATITVSGKTDHAEVTNHYTASLRDDHVLPDILWDSGPLTAGPDEKVLQVFEVELWCNKRRKVVGPAGSSHEKTAEIYAHVAAEEREGQSDNIQVRCT